MKKYLFLAVLALIALSACTSDDLVDKTSVDNSKLASSNVMSFNVKSKNMTRGTTQALESTGQYNFGVFAYKNTSGKNHETVMNNYLVGYHSEAPLTPHGYALNGQSTYGPSDNLNDATSLWFYEGLGYEEYENSLNSATLLQI